MNHKKVKWAKSQSQQSKNDILPLQVTQKAGDHP